ncbi:MAG: SpoIIE family protein phosphatase [Ruminococcus sp.]|nr:SpoIIE family protein phosphatase [Ruminococcus sp.]
MKKTKSLFFKIGVIMTLIILILDGFILLVSYNITYENNLKIFEEDITTAAELGVQYSESYDLRDDTADPRPYSALYDNICDMLGITYLYALDIDIEDQIETYLAIGFGENASEEAQTTRYRGVTVQGDLNDSEIEVYSGKSKGVILHEKSHFDDSLICYMPCVRHYDTARSDYVYYDKPVIVGAEISLTVVSERFAQQFRTTALLTVALTLIVFLAFALILYFKVSKPLRRISGRMTSFISDREKGIEKLAVKGNDELALMSHSFNTMTDEINSYINDIDALTREKHTHEAELNIAHNIQRGLLQPARMDSETAEIFAYMLPAKDVGGDLYDYRVLDDGRIFVTIADVSGKGVSAALFMARAITLLNQYAKLGYQPARILEEYNNTLAAQNPRRMFITTFVAFYDPADGILTYANAGHNYPYILSDTVIPLKEGHGVAAGLFRNAVYKNASVKMKAGDTLFLYTDGVNEAENIHGELYSTERLEEKLASCIKGVAVDAVTYILSDLKDFTAGAEQNDDITMLSLHLKK